MRRDVLELRRFYATAQGRAVREMAGRKIRESWEDARGLDLLGLGYATPYLSMFGDAARRTVVAMPAAQGVEAWPAGQPNLSCLVADDALPFGNALFDRVLVVHALEESSDAGALLEEVWRVLAPSGRVMLVAAARMGLWSESEKTPFGHGRPFTRRQLEALVREAELEPTAWSRAVYVPPVEALMPWADLFEQVGSRVWPGVSGLILLEAVKQTWAVKPRGVRARRRSLSPVLLPAPVGAARTTPAKADQAAPAIARRANPAKTT